MDLCGNAADLRGILSAEIQNQPPCHCDSAGILSGHLFRRLIEKTGTKYLQTGSSSEIDIAIPVGLWVLARAKLSQKATLLTQCSSRIDPGVASPPSAANGWLATCANTESQIQTQACTP